MIILFQFILFASIVAIAAALPGYYSGQEYAEVEAAHEYGQIARGDQSHEHYEHHDHHDEPVDYYVRIPIYNLIILIILFDQNCSTNFFL